MCVATPRSLAGGRLLEERVKESFADAVLIEEIADMRAYNIPLSGLGSMAKAFRTLEKREKKKNASFRDHILMSLFS